MMKNCMRCKQDQRLLEFYKGKRLKDGVGHICRSCRKIELKAEKEELKIKEVQKVEKLKIKEEKLITEKERRRESSRKSHSKHKEKHNKACRDWYEKNAEERKKQMRQYNKENSTKLNANAMKRYACKIKRTPPWLAEDHFIEIESYYAEARELTDFFGIPWEVDHIVPLQGRNVSGLHVPWNLRVVPRSVNRRKSNKLIAVA